MQSATPSGHAEPTTGFAPAFAGLQDRCLLRSSHVGDKHEREESNPVEQFWRLPALPGAHSCGSKRGIRRESNPHLLVHSQACSDRYTTDTISWAAGTEVGAAHE